MKPTTKPVIAFIDDDTDLLATYRNALRNTFEVVIFGSAQEFLNYLKDQKGPQPEAFISDFNMPGMSGLELMGQLRVLNTTIPAILLSGQLNTHLAIDAIDAGYLNILEKPVALRTLTERLDMLLNESHLRRIQARFRETVGCLQEAYASLRLFYDSHIDELESLSETFDPSAPEEDRPQPGLYSLIQDLEKQVNDCLEMEKELALRRSSRTPAATSVDTPKRLAK